MTIERPVDLAVQHLVFRLFYCLDTRDYAGVAAAFHEDGVWLRQGKRLVGPAEIIKALEGRSSTMVIHNVITNLFYESVNDRRGKVTCYLTAYRHDNGKPASGPAPLAAPAQVGFCHGEVSQVNSKWRLSQLDTVPPTFLASVKP
jgi:hypothetical protein